MVKTITLLTKSKKYNNYCIAGIDNKTGEWIRLISDDDSIHNAVPPQDLAYKNGYEAQVLDIVEVQIKSYVPNYYQPENFIYDAEWYWEKVGEATLNQVLGLHSQSRDQYIFHNLDKKLPKGFVQSLHQDMRYSLKLIIPQNASLRVKRWQPNQGLRYSTSFRYNDRYYSYFSITDEAFTNKYQRPGDYRLDDVAFVISLADLYERDECHYKLVASIIEY